MGACPIASMSATDLEAVTFRGAGSAGRGYVGGIEVLWRAGARPTTLVGTSAGAIAASILGVHYSPQALRDALSDPALARLADDLHGVARFVEGPVDLLRLRFRGGKNGGKPLHDWLKRWLGTTTFAWLTDETERRVEAWAWDLEARQLARFSVDTTPHVPVWLACAASAAIPGYFVPVTIDGRRYCDGGLALNDPLPQLAASGRFEPRQVVGFRVKPSRNTRQVAPPREHFDLWALLESVGKGLVESSEAAALASMSNAWKARQIEIDRLGVGSTEWTLSPDREAALIESGRAATRAWLELQGR